MVDWTDLTVGLPVFLAVVAAVAAAGVIVSELLQRRRLEGRISRFATPKAQSQAEPTTLLKERLTEKLAQVDWAAPMARSVGLLESLIEQADQRIRATTLLTFCAAFAFLGLAVPIGVGLPPYCWPLGLLAGMLPILWILWCRSRRIKKFEAQLPEALSMLARALRAGYSLPAALQMVGTEMPPPIGMEFLRVYETQNLGIPLEEALEELGQRVPLVDVRFLVTAISIQRQTGGDLAEILDKLAYVIRERFKLYGQVKALTAEGRLSGWVLNALPVIVFIALLILNPSYVLLLFTDPLGKKMIAVAGFMQVLGALAIRKIVNIKV